MELQHLKDIAAKLNMNVHHNLGAEKLEAKIKEQCEEMGITIEEVSESILASQTNLDSNESSDDEPKDNVPTNDENKDVKTSPTDNDAFIEKLKNLTFTQAESKAAKQSADERLKDAMKLVRCVVTCNNKNKTEYLGEVFSVQNAKLKEVKKFVPFGEITHIPQILFNMLKERKYQMFKTKRENGIPKTTSHLINEFNIDVLPPITREELEAIKQKQLAEGFTGV